MNYDAVKQAADAIATATGRSSHDTGVFGSIMAVNILNL